MEIHLIIEVTDALRRAIAHHDGGRELADTETCRSYFETLVDAHIEALLEEDHWRRKPLD
jgi:hypothetical protein